MAFKSNMLVGSLVGNYLGKPFSKDFDWIFNYKPSSNKRSGLANKALASASLILQPPENSLFEWKKKKLKIKKIFSFFFGAIYLVFFCWSAGLKPRPHKILAALETALSASIASNSA